MAKAKRCQTSSQPIAITTASTTALTSSAACDAATTVLRLKRSDARPENGATNGCGRLPTLLIAATVPVEPVRSYDSQPIVVSWIHIAADWKALPSQTRRKSR
jgi:hypothetical protein